MNLLISPWTTFFKKKSQRIGKGMLSAFLCAYIVAFVFQTTSLTVLAAPVTTEDYEREA
jgi:hypothetical protein